MVKDLHEDKDPGEEKRFKSNPFKIKLRENGNILFSGNLSKIGNQKMDRSLIPSFSIIVPTQESKNNKEIMSD